MKGKYLQIRISDDEQELLKRLSAERGMSMSEYVLTLIKESEHGFDNVDNRGSWIVRCLNKIRRI